MKEPQDKINMLTETLRRIVDVSYSKDTLDHTAQMRRIALDALITLNPEGLEPSVVNYVDNVGS